MHRGAKTPHLKTTASPSKEKTLYIPFLLIASTRNLAPPRPSDDPCNVQQICHTVRGLGSLPGNVALRRQSSPSCESSWEENTPCRAPAYCHCYKGCNKNSPPEQKFEHFHIMHWTNQSTNPIGLEYLPSSTSPCKSQSHVTI